MTGRAPRAVVFGCGGPALSRDERRLFADCDPLGFILFARNCIEPAQVRSLVEAMRSTVGRDDAPVLIDQEGGRVARLTPPHWRSAPPASAFAAMHRHDPARAVAAARLNARLIAAELDDLGITVDCAPVLDIPQPGADAVIGDRAAGDTPAQAAALGRAACLGFLEGGVLPVIKHIPGHGRATVDSHRELPRVDTPLENLEVVDFAPFRELNDMPWAMTAHVVFSALDPERPATTSESVIQGVIRQGIGFDGVLVSDDLCMGALSGPPEARATAALAAGCDVALHCNGVLDEMEAVAGACPRLEPAALTRLQRAESMRRAPTPFDRAEAERELAALMDKAAA